jgi:actin related protein 2/3 complex, subunit 2
MMAIDPHQPLLQEAISSILSSSVDLASYHQQIADYDGVLFLLHGLSDTQLSVTLISETVQSIGPAGGFVSIAEHLPGLVSDSTNPGSFTLLLDKSQVSASDAADLASRFSLFRTVFASGPIAQALKAVAQGRNATPAEVTVRTTDKLWIVPGDGRVSFVFQINYKDENDASLARIFLQEFQDAKKQVNNAPVISFGAVPPESIAQYRAKKEGLYLNITMLRAQITNPIEQAMWMSSLRQYLSYHIHSCKTNLHIRMRKRTDILLTALKQAVPEKLEEKIFKKVRASKVMKEEAKIINNFRG